MALHDDQSTQSLPSGGLAVCRTRHSNVLYTNRQFAIYEYVGQAVKS